MAHKKGKPSFKMPTAEEFLKMKNTEKKDPVWVRLEKDMRANEDIKPYNEKVGIWCQFLEQLKRYQYCEIKRHLKEIERDCGPPWFCEFSSIQKQMLDELSDRIKEDTIVGRPFKVRSALKQLGITMKFPTKTLMEAMSNCRADHGVFIWNLFEAIYQNPPSVLLESYDINAKLLMSSLVFIDIDECIETFNEVTRGKMEQPPKKKISTEKPKKNLNESKKFGVYLQTLKVPLVALSPEPKPYKPPRVDYRFKMRSDQALEKLRMNTEFLEKRKNRKTLRIFKDRVCDYKFFIPKASTKGIDTKKMALILKTRMLGLKATMKPPLTGNSGMLAAGVSYTGNLPRFVVSTVIRLPTEYMLISSGYYMFRNKALGIVEFLPVISGFWKPKEQRLKTCDKACDCLTKWDGKVMEHLEETICKCHTFDNNNNNEVAQNNEESQKPTQSIPQVLNKPNKYGPMWFDEALMYRFDPTEDIIKEFVRKAVKSSTSLIDTDRPTLNAEDMAPKDIIITLLADLARSPLIIPHLPKAYLLNSLHAWVRKRLYGKIPPEKAKSMWAQAQRRQLQISRADFRAKANRIPFTREQLDHFSFKYRRQLQDMYDRLLEGFYTRNRLLQLQQSRLWWSTAHYDDYPSKSFLDAFFAYSPGPKMDASLFNPFCIRDIKDTNKRPCATH